MNTGTPVKRRIAKLVWVENLGGELFHGLPVLPDMGLSVSAWFALLFSRSSHTRHQLSQFLSLLPFGLIFGLCLRFCDSPGEPAGKRGFRVSSWVIKSTASKGSLRFLIAGPDRLTHETRIAFVYQIDRTDLSAKSYDVFHRKVEQVRGPGLCANDSPALIHSIFEQHEESLTAKMSRRLRTANDKISDIGIGYDVAYDLFNPDAFSLEGSGKSCATLHAQPDQAFNIRWDVFLVIDEDYSDCDRGKVVAAEVSTVLRRIIRMGFYF